MIATPIACETNDFGPEKSQILTLIPLFEPSALGGKTSSETHVYLYLVAWEEQLLFNYC